MTPANLANVLGALASKLSDQVMGVIATAELPLVDATALSLVSQYPDCSIEELRAPLGLSHSGCVRLVDRLVAGGHLERRTGEDGRTVALRLTASGRSLVEAGAERRVEALVRAISILDPEERCSLERIASKLLAHGISNPYAAGKICRLCDHQVCVECPFHSLAHAHA